ncbi:MAG: hypothetical protein P0Y53_20175 [Candidatus Pseudobacter hemicellulosilyticus]|uniref:Uncharacterized protein n=1 Tax=Candidatus Pseudobacter hemicellulosilyticus TaxID=3121375 RepID=A0AAJ5WMS5_9BACT|nr:MAG: hypothetical protein P0Y53_20175 [Pseudobacter sp.]
MNSLSLPVVHPSFERLKQSGRLLHLIAGGLILLHAISHFTEPHSSPVYSGCLLLMALDIFILVFAGGPILQSMPRVNLFFRLAELLFFVGIGLYLLFGHHWLTGVFHCLLSVVYTYLFFCEIRLIRTEQLAIYHTGVSIPALSGDKFFIWSNINHIDARYDSITIDTSGSHQYYFPLRKNLQFEELDQIHEFCRHYLGSGHS